MIDMFHYFLFFARRKYAPAKTLSVRLASTCCTTSQCRIGTPKFTVGANLIEKKYCGIFLTGENNGAISYRLAQMEEAADTADENKAFKILQHIISKLVINGRSLSSNGFLAGRKSVADLKTLSSCGPYPNDRTGNLSSRP